MVKYTATRAIGIQKAAPTSTVATTLGVADLSASTHSEKPVTAATNPAFPYIIPDDIDALTPLPLSLHQHLWWWLQDLFAAIHTHTSSVCQRLTVFGGPPA